MRYMKDDIFGKLIPGVLVSMFGRPDDVPFYVDLKKYIGIVMVSSETAFPANHRIYCLTSCGQVKKFYVNREDVKILSDIDLIDASEQ